MRQRHVTSTRPGPHDAAAAATGVAAAATAPTWWLEALPVAALLADHAGKVTAWNGRAAMLLETHTTRLAGAPLAAVLGRDVLWPLTASHAHQCVTCSLPLPNGTRRQVNAWVSTTWPDGGAAWSTVLLTPAQVHGGDPTGGVPRVVSWAEVAESLALLEGEHVSIGIGLCGLRAVNECYSRSTGDAVLAAVHDRLLAFSPPDAIVERISGNRFVVITSTAGVDSPERLVCRLMDVVRRPIETPLGRVAVGCVAGVDVGVTRPGLVAVDRVNRKLAEARTRGPGTVVWDRAGGRPTAGSARMAASLVDSIESGLVSAHFQPIVDLTTGAVVGHEALARWDHRENDQPDTAAFVEAARVTGTLAGVDHVVLDDALRFVSDVRHQPGSPDAYVSVNTGVRELTTPGFVDHVHARLTSWALPPHALCIELCADLATSDLPDVRPVLAALRSSGVSIALDGAARCVDTMLALGEGAVDVVKLAAAATRVGEHPERLLRSMIELAGQLGVTMVATGIETQAQHEVAVRAGCRFVQGYFYGRPRPRERVELGPVFVADGGRRIDA